MVNFGFSKDDDDPYGNVFIEDEEDDKSHIERLVVCDT